MSLSPSALLQRQQRKPDDGERLYLRQLDELQAGDRAYAWRMRLLAVLAVIALLALIYVLR